MAYASIDPRMWDDEKFVQLDDSAQLLWAYLITGPEALACLPGLLVIGIAGLAEARRRSTQDIAASLERLRVAGMVEIDPTFRLIRVPKAPLYRPAGNPNVVRGWYRRWTSLPNSQLKYAHVEVMREALALADVSPSTRQAFEDTFGRDLARRVAFRQGDRAAVVAQQIPAPAALDRPLQETMSFSSQETEPVRVLGAVEPFGNHSRMVSSGNATGSSSGTEIRDPEASRDPTPPDPDAAAPPPEPEPTPAELAHELRQDRLRRVLALRAAGIGAHLPAPSLADEVAPGEPERLVRRWFAAAGPEPVATVRARGRALLDALEAQARGEQSLACLRETVCYSPKVVDWALNGGSPGRSRSGPTTPPPGSPPRGPAPPRSDPSVGTMSFAEKARQCREQRASAGGVP